MQLRTDRQAKALAALESGWRSFFHDERVRFIA
jgi:hypothetical protein